MAGKICFWCFKARGNHAVCPHCGYEPGSDSGQAYQLSPGTILQKRYVIGASIGFGGFGITYKAFDAMLRMIAIIEYVGLHATDPEAGDADSHAPEGLAQTEANFWKKLQENWENQGTRSLFTYAIITNHLEAYCKKFTSMYQKYNISGHLHPDLKPPYTEDFYRCEADMHCYIKILEKRSRFFQRLIWNKTSSCQADYKNQPDESIKTEFEQLENELLDAAGQFAAPIVFATKAIMDLK